jgi:hypothetical protein
VVASLDVSQVSTSRRQRVLWVSLVLCLAGVLMIVAVGSYVQEKSIDDLAGSFVVPVLTPTPSVVCRNVVTAACARRAAVASKMAVAWMSAPKGFHLAMLYASAPAGSPASAQALFLSDAGGPSQISLDTATELQPRLTFAGTVGYGLKKATLSQETLNGVVLENELRWTHAGYTYALLGVGGDLDTTTLIEAWRTVHYAKPLATR